MFLGLSLIGAQAATTYVATTGSDSNPGTSAQPFRTITYAYSKASAGTTILVAPGTYTDYTSGWGWHLNKSGSSGSPIVLKSQVRGGAILDSGFASSAHHGIYLDGSYNIVDGFAITRAPQTGVFVTGGNSSQIINCEIYNNSTAGSSDPEGQGIFSDPSTSGNIYNNNYIHDNGFSGSNLDHGLYLCGQRETVCNNVVIRHPSRGLQIAGYTAISGTKVYNNVFAYNAKDGITVWQGMNGVEIRNNISYANGRNGVQFYAATGSGVTLDHNIIFGNAAANYNLTDGGSTCSYTLGTTISSDPKFVNNSSSSFNARLNSGSPAIGAGLNYYSTITTDIAGAARSSSGAWDIGAYVYGATNNTSTNNTSTNNTPTNPPSVSMTAPGNGASYAAPATINLAASVTPNGHTITAVKFYNGSTLLGQSTASPYTFTWNNVGAAVYGINATVVYDAGSTANSALRTVTVTNQTIVNGLTFAATSGTISAPFTVTNNNAIVQPAYTALSLSGQAVYNFSVSTAGSYVIKAQVSAPSTDNNSLFVNIDAQPADPTMVWDVPVTTGFASQTASWRGNAGADTNSPSGMGAQYAPAVFNLSAGNHQLIVRGREGLVQLGTITIAPYGQSAPPTVSMTAPGNGATVSGNNVVVSANASSSVGVARVQFKLDGVNLGTPFTAAPYSGIVDSTTMSNGSHTFTAVATDTIGNQTTAASVTVLVSNAVASNLPTLSVSATTPNASRVGPTNGVYTVTRTGNTSAALTVNFSLAGTAANGVDYTALPASATIPAGAVSTTITVTPLPSATCVASETAVLTLAANSSYNVGSSGNATVNIAGNSVPSSISMANRSIQITWKSIAGKNYRVAYKNSMSDATWTDLSSLITATSTSTSYTDATANKHTTRYYVVYVTN